MKKIAIVLPEELHKKLKEEAKRTGITLSALIKVILTNYIKGGDK